METRGSSSLLCAIILYATTLNSIGCHGEREHYSKLLEKEHKLLFVFGDSLFDPGNNQYLNTSEKSPATSWPYGMNLNNKSTGRLSDGLLVPDFIALFANLTIAPPVLKPGADFTDGANFASAGGAVLDDHSNEVMNLKAQLANFKAVAKSLTQKVGAQEARNILMRSVYLFSLGGNDYFSYNTNYPNSTQSQRIAYMRMVIANLTNGFKEIYAMGGRKFAIQNVGPLGCLPMIKAKYPELNGSCVINFSIHANLHNKALSNALKKFTNQLPGFKYSIMDYYHALGDRMINPTKYGFKVGNASCYARVGESSHQLCKNPNEYVFFDGGHTTQQTNRQLAQLLWSGVPNLTAPYNVKQLFEFA